MLAGSVGSGAIRYGGGATSPSFENHQEKTGAATGSKAQTLRRHSAQDGRPPARVTTVARRALHDAKTPGASVFLLERHARLVHPPPLLTPVGVPHAGGWRHPQAMALSHPAGGSPHGPHTPRQTVRRRRGDGEGDHSTGRRGKRVPGPVRSDGGAPHRQRHTSLPPPPPSSTARLGHGHVPTHPGVVAGQRAGLRIGGGRYCNERAGSTQPDACTQWSSLRGSTAFWTSKRWHRRFAAPVWDRGAPSRATESIVNNSGYLYRLFHSRTSSRP